MTNVIMTKHCTSDLHEAFFQLADCASVSPIRYRVTLFLTTAEVLQDTFVSSAYSTQHPQGPKSSTSIAMPRWKLEASRSVQGTSDAEINAK